MKRRHFVPATLGALGSATGCQPDTTGPAESLGFDYARGQPLPWINWAGNQGCVPANRFAPENEEQLLDFLSSTQTAVRPVGAGHSFSPLVPTDHTLLAADLMSGVISTNATVDTQTVEVWAGTRLHQLGPLLHNAGHALPCLPDIAYQTIAGATNTSTHGAGVRFGSLSSFIAGLTIATPGGDLVECNREQNADLFHAGRCGLGTLGIVTRLTLNTVPAFFLQETSKAEPLTDVLENVAHENKVNRHFELFAFPHTDLALVVRTNAIAQPASVQTAEEDPLSVNQLRDAYRRIGTLPLVGERLYDAALSLLGDSVAAIRRGPAHAVLTHDRVVRFREMEYTVAAEDGPACLNEILDTIRDKRLPVVFPIEYRYVHEDDIWLSMFSSRAGCTISVHQYADEDYRPFFDVIEPIFWKYSGRPHWGKLHSLNADALRPALSTLERF